MKDDMRESVARLQEIRGTLNEALQCLDEGMATPNLNGYEALARARERLMDALARLMVVERGLIEEVRKGEHPHAASARGRDCRR